jgi:hypothetical protein
MMLIMKRYITLAVIAILCWSAASAQQNELPSRSLTIEGAYNPTITRTDKVMPVPERQLTDYKTAQVNYLMDSNPMTNLERNPMVSFSESSDDVIPDRFTSLLRFGYGLRNVQDGLLDLNWRISDRDELQISGLLDGWVTEPSGDWTSKMFNGDLKAVYLHRFDRFDVGVDGAYGHSFFNYRPAEDMNPATFQSSTLTQNVNRGEFGLSLSGDASEVKWHFRAAMEYLSRNGLNVAGTDRTNKEGLVRIDGGLEMPLLGGMGGLDYRQKTAMYDWQGLNGCDYSGFTALTFSPFWKQSWEKWDARLGVNLDIRTRAGYVLMMSPMAFATFNASDSFKLHVGLTGGIEDNAMRTLSIISPYWSEKERIRDGYTLANAFLGMSLSPGRWFSMSAKAGYRHTVDEVFQTVSDNLIVTSLLLQRSSDVLYFRLDADMQFSDRAILKMDLTYNNYFGHSYGIKMQLKPAFDANVYGCFKLARGLDAMLSYKLMLFHSVNKVAMPTVNDVALTVDYDLCKRLSLYTTLKHLAGGDFFYYAGYRVIKPSVVIGATYRF